MRVQFGVISPAQQTKDNTRSIEKIRENGEDRDRERDRERERTLTEATITNIVGNNGKRVSK